jgi:hypothetical protein
LGVTMEVEEAIDRVDLLITDLLAGDLWGLDHAQRVFALRLRDLADKLVKKTGADVFQGLL